MYRTLAPQGALRLVRIVYELTVLMCNKEQGKFWIYIVPVRIRFLCVAVPSVVKLLKAHVSNRAIVAEQAGTPIMA